MTLMEGRGGEFIACLYWFPSHGDGIRFYGQIKSTCRLLKHGNKMCRNISILSTCLVRESMKRSFVNTWILGGKGGL